ncbi:MAG TPA: hypothetical protein VJV78_15570 [Polyangiales bacterium]|nr:hypothetical protein [Polyangiales bacterium]
MKALDPEGRRLIDDVLAADKPDPGAEARSWSSLAERLHQPLPPTAAAAKTALEASAPLAKGAALAQLGGWKAIVAGVACAGAGVWYAAQQPAPPAPKPEARPAPAVVAPTVVPPRPETPPEPPPSATGSSLSEEARLIAQAERARNSGNPGRALALLEEHARTYAQGALAQERDAARVLVLCALGRTRDARESRKLFLRDWANSTLAARVRSACKGSR